MSPSLSLGHADALFFDVDGTLVDIAPRPEDVLVRPGLADLLRRHATRQGGAMAIVSGRPLEQIDALLQPLVLPAAGVHGVERRRADGSVRRLPAPELSAARSLLEGLCRSHPGLRLEIKPGSLALHYRQAPALEALCTFTMQEAERLSPGTSMLHGKRVVELKPKQANKGHAVREFMAEPPFSGRRPWFFGDDVTDEQAFEAVRAAGGVTVKIGQGKSVAEYRLADPAALHDWLASALVAPV